jgi:hypothetical protein
MPASAITREKTYISSRSASQFLGVVHPQRPVASLDSKLINTSVMPALAITQWKIHISSNCISLVQQLLQLQRHQLPPPITNPSTSMWWQHEQLHIGERTPPALVLLESRSFYSFSIRRNPLPPSVAEPSTPMWTQHQQSLNGERTPSAIVLLCFSNLTALAAPASHYHSR